MDGTVWTEGVCGDGAAILRDGRLMAISDVLETLNDRERRAETAPTLLAALKDGLSLAGGWREAIVELEDWCHEPVRLKNMLAAADQLDRWAKAARDAIDKAEAA